MKYIKSKDLATVLAADHNQTSSYSNVRFETPQDYFFGDESSCVLRPNFTLPEGPYCELHEFFLIMKFFDRIFRRCGRAHPQERNRELNRS